LFQSQLYYDYNFKGESLKLQLPSDIIKNNPKQIRTIVKM